MTCCAARLADCMKCSVEMRRSRTFLCLLFVKRLDKLLLQGTIFLQSVISPIGTTHLLFSVERRIEGEKSQPVAGHHPHARRNRAILPLLALFKPGRVQVEDDPLHARWVVKKHTVEWSPIFGVIVSMTRHDPVFFDDDTSHTSRIMWHAPVRARILSFYAYPLADFESFRRGGVRAQLPRLGYGRLERIANTDKALLGHEARKFIFAHFLRPIRSPRENHVSDV